VTFLQKLLENPDGLRRLKRWFYAGLIVIVLGELAIPRLLPERAHFWFEDLQAWGSIFGLISCLAIIFVSKLLGHLWLLRREDYYDS
jgi:hypothetical protein